MEIDERHHPAAARAAVMAGRGNGAADADTAVFAVTQQPPWVRPPDVKPFRDLPQQQEPAPRTGGMRRRRGRQPFWIRRRWTVTQVIGGILIAAVCVAAMLWYVPRVISSDRKTLTGTVTSSGIVMLNFPNAGIISNVKVHLGQPVHKGQVLAVEYVPNGGSLTDLVNAEKASIAAVQAKITELKQDEAINPAHAPADTAEIASQNAQMAQDEAQLATDHMRMAATEIVAPAAGVVVSANGQPGEAVTSSGIRDYASAAQPVSSQQQPQFSLLPEGPQAVSRAAGNGSSLPVIAMRISSNWQVVAFIPEGSVQSIKGGQAVSVSVPAARIKDVPAQIQEVLPNPATTSTGPMYQAMINITGQVTNPPLNGMAANIQLSS